MKRAGSDVPVPDPLPRLRVTSSESTAHQCTETDDGSTLLTYADPQDPIVWLRDGEGLVGRGEVLRLEFSGATRFADAASAWRALLADAVVDDRVCVPGSGLVAFGSFAFADGSTRASVLIVPRTIVGRRDGRAWVTTIEALTDADAASEQTGSAGPVTAIEPTAAIEFTEGAAGATDYLRAVEQAVVRIRSGALEKLVLARDLVARIDAAGDLRAPIERMAHTYRQTWTFAVGGLLGASPETLVRVRGGVASTRVLAGTTARGTGDADDAAHETALLHSVKDSDEHAFAVQSARATLGAHVVELTSSPRPFTLRLPNLWHLATDLQGRLADESGTLELIGAMHPTAAVAGTPTRTAQRLIDEIEPFDRGGYAGPVGWVGADGDGEWAIALRCAQVSPLEPTAHAATEAARRTVRAYAGCGVVAESVPMEELAESEIKFRPIVEAFGAAVRA